MRKITIFTIFTFNPMYLNQSMATEQIAQLCGYHFYILCMAKYLSYLLRMSKYLPHLLRMFKYR